MAYARNLRPARGATQAAWQRFIRHYRAACADPSPLVRDTWAEAQAHGERIRAEEERAREVADMAAQARGRPDPADAERERAARKAQRHQPRGRGRGRRGTGNRADGVTGPGKPRRGGSSRS